MLGQSYAILAKANNMTPVINTELAYYSQQSLTFILLPEMSAIYHPQATLKSNGVSDLLFSTTDSDSLGR